MSKAFVSSIISFLFHRSQSISNDYRLSGLGYHNVISPLLCILILNIYFAFAFAL